MSQQIQVPLPDPVNRFQHGDARAVMRQIANQRFWCIITSPPYYDARYYGEVDEIFGGDPNCDHIWIKHAYKMHNGRGDAQKSAKYSEQADVKDNQLCFHTCKKCMAWKGQLGHERTPEEFISHLCDYFDECMRVLNDMGTLFVVIGDTMEKKTKSYLGIPGMFMQEMRRRGWACRQDMIWEKPNVKPENVTDRPSINYEHIFMFVKKVKTRFYVNKKRRLVSRKKLDDHEENADWRWVRKDLKEGETEPKKGWVDGATIGRQAGTWWIKDSYWQSCDYYYEQQYEPYADSTIVEALSKYLGKALKAYEGAQAENASDVKRRINESTMQSLIDSGALDNLDMEKLGLKMPPAGGKKMAGGDNPTYSGNRPDYKWGRIMRSVISMQTARYKGAHFAVFPLELVEILLQMGCPPAVCRFCGLPKVRLTSEVRINTRPGDNVNKEKSGSDADPNKNFHRSIITKYRQAILRAKHDEYAECDCHAIKGGEVVNKWAKPVVYDPFCGSGSTCVAADRMGRAWFGTERNPDFVLQEEKRMKEDPWKPGNWKQNVEKGRDVKGNEYVPLDAYDITP